MPKKPISMTLEESNLLWLKGVTERAGARSVSETLDQLITAAREQGDTAARSARSVVGTVDILASDPRLEHANEAISALFAESLARPMLAKEAAATLRTSRRSRG